MRNRKLLMPSARRAGDVRIESQTPGAMRGGVRRPQHTWNTEIKPWEITPCLIAPVLAGDSLKLGQLQIRTLGYSPPLGNLASGWWHEFYLFYVRLRDLEVAETMRTAIVDPSANMDAINLAADAKWMHQAASRPSWVYECYRTVVRAYFRDEGEAWNAHVGVGGYSLAQISGQGVEDSIVRSADLPAETAGDAWGRAWEVYQGMRNAKLTTSTYEEYLAMQGVQAPPVLRETVQDFKRPEILRFVRDFAYPQTTVAYDTGMLVGSVNWSVAERVDKRRFFDEPGFLFGLQVIRPKVYLRNRRTAAVDVLLNTAEGWLPPQFDQEPHTSIVKTTGGAAGNQLVHGATVDHWADRRDLFLRGDQFLNVDLAAATAGSYNLVALPTTDLSRIKYPDTTDQQNIVGASGVFKSDGIASFAIASRISADLTA